MRQERHQLQESSTIMDKLKRTVYMHQERDRERMNLVSGSCYSRHNLPSPLQGVGSGFLPDAWSTFQRENVNWVKLFFGTGSDHTFVWGEGIMLKKFDLVSHNDCSGEVSQRGERERERERRVMMKEGPWVDILLSSWQANEKMMKKTWYKNK